MVWRLCCVCKIYKHIDKENMSKETCWHEILRISKWLTLSELFRQVCDMCNDGSIILCYVNAVVVEWYALWICGIYNGVMKMVCSGVMWIHAGFVRTSCQLQFFPFILWICGLCNGVMLMVCIGVMWMHAGCVSL